ncbi:hypothetical protein HW555_014084 [Spodoptera exigua]|uniref:Glycerate kinase n=1 Tax=Spodoptera exigua TaxID=7107 RepID=A0A835KZ76_SPOEX|nr:hypothetical protein HW555_014084 [Spodoptera exigua]
MKGSLSSITANKVVGEVFSKYGHDITQVAIADGGEGTVEAVVKNNNGKKIAVDVHGLTNQQISADFGWFETEKLAVIESAAASGIQFLDGTQQTHPLNTSSFGTGELILAAVKKGAKTIVVGLGGTGTIDGGIGLLSALGVEFFDKQNRPLPAKGGSLGKIEHFSIKNLPPKLGTITFVIASDVTSSLLGDSGAVYMFGRQKGIQADQLVAYEESMHQYQKVITGKNEFVEGDGAAGGIGFALRVFLKGRTYSGFDFISEQIRLEKLIQASDLVITGEGKMDNQSLQGKVPVGIGRLAKKYHVPVIAFVGSFSGDELLFAEEGVSVIMPIIDDLTTLEQAMINAEKNLRKTAERTIRLLDLFE